MVPFLQKLALFTILFSTIGCYSLGKKYNYGQSFYEAPDLWTVEDPQFEEGKPDKWLDGVGNYFFSIPSKIVLWNKKADNHTISPEVKKITEKYIRENNLRHVKVRFNQYAPVSELRRIWANDTIHPSVKYTVGLFSWLVYTIFPQRLFAGTIGGDHYNPFSNTISLSSDLAVVAIHEGGHAKDFNQREYKTLYAAVYAIPILGSLYHEAVATDDAIAYFEEQKMDSEIEESYKILVPAYSTYVGGSVGDILQTPYSVVAVIPGHIYGRYKARKFRKEGGLDKSSPRHNTEK